MSFGFHYYKTLNQSLTLQYFDKAKTRVVFGKLGGVAATNIAAGAAIFVTAPVLTYRPQYLACGVILAGGALWTLFQKPSDRNLIPPQRK